LQVDVFRTPIVSQCNRHHPRLPRHQSRAVVLGVHAGNSVERVRPQKIPRAEGNILFGEPGLFFLARPESAEILLMAKQ
jgi:hypothetical protein